VVSGSERAAGSSESRATITRGPIRTWSDTSGVRAKDCLGGEGREASGREVVEIARGLIERAGRRRCAGMSDAALTAASRGAALTFPSLPLGRSFWRSTPWRRASLPLGVKSAEHRLEMPAPSATLAVSPPRVRPTHRYNHRVSTSPWPSLHDEDRWLLAAMEDQLRDSTRSAEQLQARARELRAQAEQSDIKGVRDASLALAGHYEEAAAARLAAR
jgi:hypothetical protein